MTIAASLSGNNIVFTKVVHSNKDKLDHVTILTYNIEDAYIALESAPISHGTETSIVKINPPAGVKVKLDPVVPDVDEKPKKSKKKEKDE